MMSKFMLGAGVVLSAALVAGCQNTREGVAEDARNAQQTSERAAEQTAEAAREAGREASQAAENAAEETGEAMREAGQATREGMTEAGREAREAAAAAGQVAREGTREVANAGDAAQQTAQIKSALMADASIDSTGIDVDTNGDTRTVTLKGHVSSAAAKTRAAQIAAQKAPGYRITNNLEVRR